MRSKVELPFAEGRIKNGLSVLKFNEEMLFPPIETVPLSPLVDWKELKGKTHSLLPLEREKGGMAIVQIDTKWIKPPGTGLQLLNQLVMWISGIEHVGAKRGKKTLHKGQKGITLFRTQLHIPFEVIGFKRPEFLQPSGFL